MALEVGKKSETSEWYESTERLWLTADGDRVVKEGDPQAASLFATPGKRISLDDAERLGLAKKPAKKPATKEAVPAGDKERKAPSSK